LYTLDEHWRDHLYELDHLKGGIGLRAYGQRDPLIEYKKEAFTLFETLLSEVREDFVQRLFRVQVEPEAVRQIERRPRPRQLVERLGSFLEGDETALETLGESIEQGDFSPDEVQSAALVLRSLSSAVAPIGESDAIAAAPGKDSQRVLSAEERELLTPEASGY